MNKILILLIGALGSGCAKSQHSIENDEMSWKTRSGHTVLQWGFKHKGYAIHDPECPKCLRDAVAPRDPISHFKTLEEAQAYADTLRTGRK